ncbi:MAG: 3-oxoacyl-[acyl-carrier-protein] synthase III C-terminal domain-containing protein [Cyanobacteria bacterium P01_G01_bin.67]
MDTILSELYLENYKKVIRKTLAKSNFCLQDLNFLFTNQVKKSLSHKILQAFELKEEQTYSSLPEYGLLGAVDTLFGLAKTLENEQINDNDIVVLASSAAGFSWAALTVKYLAVGWHP